MMCRNKRVFDLLLRMRCDERAHCTVNGAHPWANGELVLLAEFRLC